MIRSITTVQYTTACTLHTFNAESYVAVTDLVFLEGGVQVDYCNSMHVTSVRQVRQKHFGFCERKYNGGVIDVSGHCEEVKYLHVGVEYPCEVRKIFGI